jgi:hypothetical protein
MKRFDAKQRVMALSVLATAALGLLVFCWGIAYKCSLYHKHAPEHTRIAVAKLLSEKERPVAEGGGRRMQAPLTQRVLLVQGVPLPEYFQKRRGGFDAILPALPCGGATVGIHCLIHFASRPPPLAA